MSADSGKGGTALYGAWRELRRDPPHIADARGDNQQILVWHIYQGAMLEKFCRARWHSHLTHYTSIPAGAKWTKTTERMPEAGDADAYSCVLAYHVLEGAKITGWHNIAHDRYYTHWTKLPEPPTDAKQVFAAFEGTDEWRKIERATHERLQHHISRKHAGNDRRSAESGAERDRRDARHGAGGTAEEAEYYGEIGSAEYLASIGLNADGANATDGGSAGDT